MQKYHPISRIIHWIMAVLIIAILCIGFYMTGISKEDPQRFKVYSLHKSLGALALVFIIIRIINRFVNKPPALPVGINKFEKTAAHVFHFALYTTMLLMPVSGYIASNSFGYSVPFFSIELPRIVGENIERGKFFIEMHELLGFAFIFIILIHVLGAVKHEIFDSKENKVIRRML